MGASLLALALVLSDASPAASHRSVVFKADKIYTGATRDAAPVHGGALHVRDQKVVRVLQRDEPLPPDADVVDLGNAVIIPGLVAAGGMLGGEALGPETAGAQYQALDAFDFYAANRDWLAAGITTAYLDPGRRRLIAGVGAVVKITGDVREQRILLDQADLRLCVSTDALGPPSYIEPPVPPSSDMPITPERVQRPTSRLGVFLELGELFARAKALDATAAKRPPYDFALEALKRAVDRGLPLRMHAQRADEIRRALAFGAGRRVVISGASEAHKLATELRSVPVVLEIPIELGRIGANRDVSREQLDATMATAALLEKSGVRFAIAAADAPTMRELLTVTGMAVGAGLSQARALAAITSEAAAILGVSERVGSLAANHDADFVVLSADPFAPGSSVLAVYTDGERRYAPRGTDGVIVSAGHVLTLEGPEMVGSVAMKDGKIAGVGRSVATTRGARVEDFGPDAYVVPGFIDAFGHLGLNSDRSRAESDLPIHRVRVAADEAALEVARAGVTTVIEAPYAPSDRGSRMAALKTAGEQTNSIVVDELCGVLFPPTDGDILELADRYKGALDQGKAYADKWQKYAEDLKKWEDEQKKGTAPVAKKEEKPAEGDEPKKESRTDPVSGKWEVTISGGPIPEPQKINVFLKLDGTKVTGRATSPMSDEEVSLSGTLDGDNLTLEMDQDTPMGKPQIQARLDRPDHMTGTFGIANFKFNLDGTRVEKNTQEVLVVSTKKKKGKDQTNKPPPPPIDEKLEPYRRLFRKEVPAVVSARGVLEVRALVKLFVDQYGLLLVLVAPGDLDRIKTEVKRPEVTIVAPTQLVAMRDKREINIPADLVQMGFTIALQSDAENAAADLPRFATYAVRGGLDPGVALEALTINAARMYKIEDRVGSLRVGKDADVLVFSGPPLAAASRLLRVYVNGKEVYRLAPE